MGYAGVLGWEIKFPEEIRLLFLVPRFQTTVCVKLIDLGASLFTRVDGGEAKK